MPGDRAGWAGAATPSAAAFGHRFIPGVVALLQPDMYDEYDAAALLDLPDHGRPVARETVVAALADLYSVEPEPKPEWLGPEDVWPPPLEPEEPQ